EFVFPKIGGRPSMEWPPDSKGSLYKVVDDQECLAIVQYRRKNWELYQSRDGGNTWSIMVRLPAPREHVQVCGWRWTADKKSRTINMQWDEVSRGELTHASTTSSDFGASWEYRAKTGRREDILASSNGGETWQMQLPGNTETFDFPGRQMHPQ